MNKCISCDVEIHNAKFPYCESCYYCGHAYAHINKPLIDLVTAAGFPFTVWQTGGGCQNYAVALTEAGWDGPTSLMGEATDNLSSWEESCLGVQMEAHPHSDYYGWVGNEPSCNACADLYEMEEQINNTRIYVTNTDEAAAWMIATAKRLSAAIAANADKHTN